MPGLKSIREQRHDEELKDRKKYKNKVDKLINLSKETKEETFSLEASSLDLNQDSKVIGVTAFQEGAVIDAANSYGIRAYFKKGTIQKAIKNVPKDVVLKLDEGHVKEDQSPFLGDLGEFTVDDMSSEKNDDGFHQLKVDVKPDLDHPIVQYYMKKNKNLSVSIELGIKENYWKEFEIGDEMAFVQVVEDFEILGLGVVGSPANVTSNKVLKFNKEDNMSDTTKKEDLEQEEIEEVDTSEASENEETSDESKDSSEESKETTDETEESSEKTEELSKKSIATDLIAQFDAAKEENAALKVELKKVETEKLSLQNELKEAEQIKEQYAVLEDYMVKEAGLIVAKDTESLAKKQNEVFDNMSKAGKL